jgi:DNA-binding XRE family transcriptional regulator
MGIVKTDTGYRVLMLGQDEPRLVRPFDVEPTQDIASAVGHRQLYEIAEAQRVDFAFLEFVLREPPTHDGDDQDAHEGMMRLVRSVLDRSFHLCTNIASVGADLVISEDITDGFHGVMAVAGGRRFDPAIREEVRPELDRRVSDARRAHRTPSAMTEDQRQMLLDLQVAAAAAIAANAAPAPAVSSVPSAWEEGVRGWQRRTGVVEGDSQAPTPDDLATREEFKAWVHSMAMNLGADEADLAKVARNPVQRAIVEDAAIKAAEGDHDDSQAQIGGRIRRLRLAAGLTQVEVASSLGIATPSVCAWEKGKSSPLAEKVVPLCRVLGCRVEDIFFDAFDAKAPAWSAEVTPPDQRPAPDLETLLGDLAVPPEDKP